LREFWLLVRFPDSDLGPVDLSELRRFARFLGWFGVKGQRPSQAALTQALPTQDPND